MDDDYMNNFDNDQRSQRFSVMMLDYIDEAGEFTIEKGGHGGVPPGSAGKDNTVGGDIMTSINEDGGQDDADRSGRVIYKHHMSHHFKNRQVNLKLDNDQ